MFLKFYNFILGIKDTITVYTKNITTSVHHSNSFISMLIVYMLEGRKYASYTPKTTRR